MLVERLCEGKSKRPASRMLVPWIPSVIIMKQLLCVYRGSRSNDVPACNVHVTTSSVPAATHTSSARSAFSAVADHLLCNCVQVCSFTRVTGHGILSLLTLNIDMASFAELKAKRGSKNGAIHSTSAAAGISASTSSTTSSTTSSDNTSMQIETLATSLMDFKPGQSSNSDTIPNSIYKLNTDLLEIRETVNAGRGLFAKKRISAGTVLIQRTPHVAILDKEHLSILCSNCMRDRGRPLKRCSGCAAVWYCSVVSD